MHPENIQKKIKNQGFTLIELLIVLIIVAILATIAIPAYQAQLLKSQRADAISTLLEMQVEQEKYRVNQTTYGTLAQVWNNVSTSPQGFYTLSISNVSSTSYTLTATAIGNQAQDSQDGTSCATMAIAVSGATENKTPTACW